MVQLWGSLSVIASVYLLLRKNIHVGLNKQQENTNTCAVRRHGHVITPITRTMSLRIQHAWGMKYGNRRLQPQNIAKPSRKTKHTKNKAPWQKHSKTIGHNPKHKTQRYFRDGPPVWSWAISEIFVFVVFFVILEGFAMVLPMGL